MQLTSLFMLNMLIEKIPWPGWWMSGWRVSSLNNSSTRSGDGIKRELSMFSQWCGGRWLFRSFKRRSILKLRSRQIKYSEIPSSHDIAFKGCIFNIKCLHTCFPELPIYKWRGLDDVLDPFVDQAKRKPSRTIWKFSREGSPPSFQLKPINFLALKSN